MHEIKEYLHYILKAMEPLTEEEEASKQLNLNGEPAKTRVPFEPTYLVVVTQLPTGALELITNTSCIADKINYILEAYDEDMKLKTNPAVSIRNLLVV